MVSFSSLLQTSIEDWTKTPWKEINVEQMDMELRRFAKVCQAFMDKQYNLSFWLELRRRETHLSHDLSLSVLHVAGDEDAGQGGTGVGCLRGSGVDCEEPVDLSESCQRAAELCRQRKTLAAAYEHHQGTRLSCCYFTVAHTM